MFQTWHAELTTTAMEVNVISADVTRRAYRAVLLTQNTLAA